MNKTRQIIRDLCITVGILGGFVFLTQVMSTFFDDNNPFASSLFILATALVSLLTKGYFFGIFASFVSVLCVNIIFTYPFWEFDLSISGYTMTFSVMLAVSIIISTLTTRIKRQEFIRAEAETEKNRANLLRAISHDLRTPLSSIIGASSSLLQDKNLSDDDSKELLTEINKDAKWLVRLTENLLSVTRFSNGSVTLKKSHEVVEEIVGSAIVKFKKNYPDIVLTADIPDEILLVPMDGILIEQVLINLFDNAVGHGRSTHIHIKTVHETKYTQIIVSDNGSGISPAAMPHLFDGTLVSNGQQTSDGRRNMGIGLSVCNSIIHAHGGKFSAKNLRDGGAEFTFTLPMEEDNNK
ncbi:MAG: DUF4118 domain-containing protein [Ruminococcaceae bacterium]|nr:DUF4118 domain-containing protein [Oscillospiraceae bacterium]